MTITVEKFDEWNRQCRKILNMSFIRKRCDELQIELKPFFQKCKTISKKYNESNDHAACFICNYNDDYICKKFNGGCKTIETCKEIYNGENEEDRY